MYNPYMQGAMTTNPSYSQMISPYQARLDSMQAQQQQQGLIRVTGIEGARAYQMGPNSSVPLFDANDDIFFVKSTDGAGFPTIKAFRFAPVEATAMPATNDFITREEFEKFKEAVLNVQQQQSPTPNNPMQFIQQFRQQMAGKNPQQMVEQLVQSGKMSTQQRDSLLQQALKRYRSECKEEIDSWKKKNGTSVKKT